jgi:2-dehydropantoate 2-reductase
VLGAGAIGGLLGAALAASGHAVTFVDRDSRLANLRERGLRVLGRNGEMSVTREGLFAGPDEVHGQFDLVLLAVKAHHIPDLAPTLKRLLGPATSLLTMQNGLPWWYFQGSKCAYEGAPLRTLDPDGTITAAVRPEHIIGTVVYPAAEILDDGTVRHVEGDRFVLGDLKGTTHGRVQRLADLISEIGFRGQVQQDIRAEIWLKTWGSLAFNTVSALTRSTMAGICRDSVTRALVTDLMLETEAVANAVGVEMRVPLERRLAGAERVGEHKTSMLQDIEAGRTTEVESVIGSVLEIARLTGTPMPKAEAVYALIRRLNDQIGR